MDCGLSVANCFFRYSNQVSPETRISLLARIRDPGDGRAWQEFVTIYAPLLHAYAMKHGLQDADAADMTQETLRLVLRAAPEFVYQPMKGTFRGWLLTVARNVLRKFANRQAMSVRGTGDSEIKRAIEETPTHDVDDDALWDHEYRSRMLHVAAERIESEFRTATWQAFWRTAVLNEPCDDVARSLGMTIGAVYIARSRVMTRIRREIEFLTGEET